MVPYWGKVMRTGAKARTKFAPRFWLIFVAIFTNFIGKLHWIVDLE